VIIQTGISRRLIV